MTSNDDPRHGHVVPNLTDLIKERRDDRGWSYRELEARSDGVVKHQRWAQLTLGVRMKEIPTPETLRAIAVALEVDVTTVVLAAAASVGLPVRQQSSELAKRLPSEADRISPRMRDAILGVVRAAVQDSEEVASDGKPQPRRQATQQAGSAPKTEGEPTFVDPEEVTPEWLAEQQAAGNLAGVTYWKDEAAMTEGDDVGTVPDNGPETRRR